MTRRMIRAFVLLAGVLLSAASGFADGLIPFVAITGRPTEEQARSKVAAIQAGGMDSFLIYARSGLEIEYLGDEWFALCRWMCDEASRRGMKVWLYDEHNWPSGTCKGRVPNENDAWRYSEYGVFRKADGSFKWTSALAPRGWVNVCEPDAVRRFIELTHEEYARRLAPWFEDGTIIGIFTDEPGHPVKVSFPEGRPLVSFRRYSGMEEEYRAATGRDMRADVEKWLSEKEQAPGKAHELSSAEVWVVYADLLGKRFRKSYFDQIRAWCDARGILLTGHLISEHDILGSARSNGDPINLIRGETLPGMDETRTVFGVGERMPRSVEWTTYNLARQAVLYRGKGGLAELFACGPADLVPASLRFVVWMCAMHGIDHYIASMDVMDERGLVEKHGWLAPAGPVHPWYADHSHVLADDARKAAAWAKKKVSGNEVAVRYPNAAAARATFAGGWVNLRAKGVRAPDLDGLLKTLECNQFTCRLIGEKEDTDLPLVFTCRMDGRYDEERTGKQDLDAAQALALCRRRVKSTFFVREADGSLAADVLVRTFADGSSAVLNMRPFEMRRLVADVGGGNIRPFELQPRGIALFASDEQPSAPRRTKAVPVGAKEWGLALDRPNTYRINFDDAKKGSVVVAKKVEGVHLVGREYATDYCVLPSGRPVGMNADPPDGSKVIRHVAEPYVFEMDGRRVKCGSPCVSLSKGFRELYRDGVPFALESGRHDFRIASGEEDNNYYLPALFIAGDFVVRDGAISPRSSGKFPLGSLADYGLGGFAGTATWSAEVDVPCSPETVLRCDTGWCVTRVAMDGVDLGVRAWPPFEWTPPASCLGKKVRLSVSVSTSVQPIFGDEKAGRWNVGFANGVRSLDGPAGLLNAEWLVPSGGRKIENDVLGISFGSSVDGFAIESIECKTGGGARFVRNDPSGNGYAKAGFWRAEFVCMDVTGGIRSVWLDNRSPCRSKRVEATGSETRFIWEGLDLPDGDSAAVDVMATVTLPPGDAESRWRISVVDRSARWGLRATRYPLLDNVVEPGEADVLLPHDNLGGRLLRNYDGKSRNARCLNGRYLYPGDHLPMVAFMRGNSGLYMAAEDPSMRIKCLDVWNTCAWFETPMENEGVPGKAAGDPGYDVTLAAFAGDWWQAAKRYRSWALKQKWTAKGPIATRKDFPASMSGPSFWLRRHLSLDTPTAAKDLADDMSRLAKDMEGVTPGFRFYAWHSSPWGAYYPEFFPAKKAAPELAALFRSFGGTVMPYTNARLWDMGLPSFSNACAHACRLIDGSFCTETYSYGPPAGIGKRTFAVMCPYSRTWQNVLSGVSARAVADLGANAVYYDQIGCSHPKLCHVPEHGHPLGGGTWWADGYRAFLGRERDKFSAQGVAMTIEGSCECYIDVCDGFLVVTAATAEDVPLLPAVYSGYAVYFGQRQNIDTPFDSAFPLMAREFTWGVVNGWNAGWGRGKDADRRRLEKATVDFARARESNRDVFLHGTLIDELRPLRPLARKRFLWKSNRRKRPDVKGDMPVVTGAWWKDISGRLVLVAVNVTGEKQIVEFSILDDGGTGTLELAPHEIVVRKF